MLSRLAKLRPAGQCAMHCALLFAFLNSGCNLEQLLDKKPKSTRTIDSSLGWTISPIIYPTTSVSLRTKVFGMINRTETTVNLYTNSDCSTLIAAGTFAEAMTGIQFSGTPNGITNVYAKVVDAVANSESSCLYVGQHLSVPPSVTALYPSHGANWNDYVVNNGSTIFNATGAACVGNETNGYLSCLHGAEMKKVAVTGADSCNGLSIADSLDAFIWTCKVVSGQAIFFSTALRPFKGLKNLINGASWRELSVTVTSAAGSISSPSTAWWSNPITPLPTNTSGVGVVALATSGTIYTLSSARATQGYAITAPKISLVTLNGASLSYTAGANNFSTITGLADGANDTHSVIGTGSQNFIWLEADISGSSTGAPIADAAILARSTKHLRIKNAKLKNSSANILDLEAVSKSAILDTKVTNCTSCANAAIEINNSSDIIVARVHVSNAAQGIANVQSTKLAYSEITAIGTDSYALEFDGSSSATVTAISAINSNNAGIDFRDTSNSTLHNALAINVNNHAIGGSSSSTITGNTWGQLAIGNSQQGLVINNSTASKITGNILLASNGANCSATDSGSGFTNACANAGLSNATFLQSASSLSASIVGKVYIDANNTSAISGAASYPIPSNVGAFDFFNFASWYRSWGLDGALFPNANHRGQFNSGSISGRIWDSRLYTSDNLIFNRTHALTTANAAIAPNAACPLQLRGDVYLTDQQSRKYLKNATEFVGDSLGNENGLCESGEVCIYTPHFGGYQGEGAVFANSCVFSNNGDSVSNVTGVSIFFYPTSGVTVPN